MEMECLAALKSSLREKLFPQSPSEEGCWAAGAAACVGDEDFAVDDLLDLSNENVEEEEEERSPASASSLDGTHLEESSYIDGGASPPAVSFPDGLANVPTEELEELEWLSRFVDDSFSEIPPACNSVPVLRQPFPVKQEAQEAAKRPAPLAFEAQLLARARSKRPRTGPRSRPGRSPTSSSSSSSSLSSCLIFANSDPNPDLFYCFKKPGPKKANRHKDRTGEAGQGAPRRCSHCLVQKTPQWRTGPLGSKTLCNACGVRYKSGRLLPEYRPAGSPTFLSHVHSNSHRKVLEMRRKKEIGVLPEPGTTAVPVQTF